MIEYLPGLYYHAPYSGFADLDGCQLDKKRVIMVLY